MEAPPGSGGHEKENGTLQPVCLHKPLEVILDEETAAARDIEVVEETEKVQAMEEETSTTN